MILLTFIVASLILKENGQIFTLQKKKKKKKKKKVAKQNIVNIFQTFST